jgi:hypothetical protein
MTLRFLSFAVPLLFCSLIVAYGQEKRTEAPLFLPSTVSSTIEQVAPNVGARRVLGVLVDPHPSFYQTPFPDAFSSSSLHGNVAEITQRGDGNLTLLQQYGRPNVASIRLNGDDNVIDAVQLNGNNTLNLSLQGSRNEIPVRQLNLLGRGNNLTFSLIGVNDVRLPFPITQVGALGRPIEITVRRVGN